MALVLGASAVGCAGALPDKFALLMTGISGGGAAWCCLLLCSAVRSLASPSTLCIERSGIRQKSWKRVSELRWGDMEAIAYSSYRPNGIPIYISKEAWPKIARWRFGPRCMVMNPDWIGFKGRDVAVMIDKYRQVFLASPSIFKR